MMLTEASAILANAGRDKYLTVLVAGRLKIHLNRGVEFFSREGAGSPCWIRLSRLGGWLPLRCAERLAQLLGRFQEFPRARRGVQILRGVGRGYPISRKRNQVRAHQPRQSSIDFIECEYRVVDLVAGGDYVR
jgi:hypothetical protein